MSSSVDDRVVAMKFDTSKFSSGVSTAVGLLDKLKSNLKFGNGKTGIDDVQASANKFSLSHMEGAITGVSGKFLALSTVAITALSNITNRAINAGVSLVKSFTISPISEGFKSYETQINAAKTIISNTGAKLPAVEAQLSQLQTYANQTVYSFSDMAQNIGTFTAAGVKLVPATSAIKGMGNTAALSGANVQQLNSAMYQMSQAMSSGTIRLQDWNSLSNANMGGQNIQQALMATASTIKGTGPQMDAAIKKYGNFRNSLTAGWLTSDVFSKTMGVMAGTIDKATGKTVAFSVAQLKAKGYTESQAKTLNRLSQAAIDSATQIRTYTQMTDALKEEVGTAWSTIFKTLFGNVNGATKLFTALHNVLEAAFTKPIYALNDFLKGVKKLGGIAIFIDAIKLAFRTLGSVITPVKEAFREIFPKQSAAQIVDLIKRFHVFIENLQPLPATLDKIKRIFAGVFAVFDIGKQIVMGIFHVFGMLFSALSHSSGGFTSFLAKIGDMLVSFDKVLKSGYLLTYFFTTIGNLLTIPIRLFHILSTAIGGLFSGFHPKSASDLHGTLSGLTSVMAKAASMTGMLSAWLANLQGKIRPGIQAVVNAFHSIGDAIAKGLNSATFGNLLKTLQVGLLGGIVLLLKNFLKGGIGVKVDVGGGIFGAAKEAIEGVTGSMKAMQTQLKAKALMEIAAAIALLTVSVVALSFVDPKKLQSSLTALAFGFGELLTSMKILGQIGGSTIKLPVMAASLNLIATSILILTAAVIAMSRLSWKQLQRGLGAVGALLLGISATALILSKNSGGMISASIGIGAIAVAMNILYLAVKSFASLSWPQLLKGLAAVGILLVGIAGAMHLMPKGMALQGIGLLAIAVGLRALASAVQTFGGMSWNVIAKGMGSIAAALLIVAGAMHLMPKGMIAQAAALVIVGLALKGVGDAVAQMGGMDISTIAKGLVAIGAALAILAGGLYLMEGTIPAAVALGLVAAALALLVPELQALGSMSVGTMVKSLLMLAGAFTALGLTALLLTPLVAPLLALGIALIALSAAIALAGVGILAIGTGLSLMAAAGSGAIAVLIGAINAFISKLPALAAAFAQAIVSFLTVLAKNGPGIVAGLGNILMALMQAVINILPRALTLFNKLIGTFLSAILTNAPRIISAALTLLVNFLNAVARKMPDIARAGANLVVSFLNGIGNNIGRVIDAGFRLIVKFLNGIADAIHNHLGEIMQAGVNIGWAIIQGVLNGLGQLGGAIADKLSGLVSSAWDDVTDFLGIGGPSKLACSAGQYIVLGLVGGLDSHAKYAAKSATSVAEGVMTAMNNGLAKVPDALNGIVDINPTITPVLDLSNVQKNASKMQGYLDSAKVSATVSTKQAAVISSDHETALNDKLEALKPVSKDIQLIQNNYSPKALSPVEIFRKTKNQISLAKEALNS